MIKLLDLEIENFGIFRDVKLDFSDKEVVGILAEYYSDSKRSNMSGKSLILEAIRYNLVGITRYKKESKMIHYDSDYMKVTCNYEDDNGKTYKIVRGRDFKNNGILELDWIEKSRESQSAISDLFGISRDDFDITSFFKQADINGFMDLSATEKTSYLQKSMDNNHWKVKEDAVKDDIKKLSSELRENDAVKKSLESSLEVEDELKFEISNNKTKSNKVKLKIEKSKSELNEIVSRIAEINNLNTKIEERIKSTKAALRNSIDGNKKRILLNNKIKSVTTEIEEMLDGEVVVDGDVEALSEKRFSLKSESEKIIRTLKESDSGGICPIIDEQCSRISVNEKEKKLMDSRLEDISSSVVDITREIKDIERSSRLKLKKDKLDLSIVSYKSRLKDLKEMSDNPDDIRTKLDKLLSKTIEQPDDLLIRRSELEDSVCDLEYDLSTLSSKISVLEHRLKSAKKNLDNINYIYDRNAIINDKLEKLKYISMMFGKSGILADEIENSFQEIQDDINYILKELDCGLTVSFSPDKELNKKESICSCGFVYYKNYKKPVCEECGSTRRNARKDEISLQILDSNGNEADFDGGSGGQKSIISYAVRIALTMFKRRQNKCQLNILFLDEVDSALDAHLATSITDSITKVLTKKLGYAQILMVSHKEEIKNSVPSIIKVIRREEYSTASFI